MRARTLITLGTLAVLLGLLEGCAAPGGKAPSTRKEDVIQREKIEWCDIWVTNADKDDLPRVLLIGDSITRAYFKGVEDHLAGKANCARVATSKCLSDPGLLPEVQLLLTQYRFQVIHVNNGMHGWSYSEAEYGKAFGPFMQTLMRESRGAEVIWAHTTPVMANGSAANERTVRVKARNAIAAAFATQHHIPVDDLFGLVVDHPDWYSTDGVHLNKLGVDAQGRQVADYILRALEHSSRRQSRPDNNRP